MDCSLRLEGCRFLVCSGDEDGMQRRLCHKLTGSDDRLASRRNLEACFEGKRRCCASEQTCRPHRGPNRDGDNAAAAERHLYINKAAFFAAASPLPFRSLSLSPGTWPRVPFWPSLATPLSRFSVSKCPEKCRHSTPPSVHMRCK